MPKDKLQNAIQFASQNPTSEFSIELKNRIGRGDYNDLLQAEGIDTNQFAPEKQPSLLKRFGQSLIRSEKEFGKSLAGAADVFTGIGGGKEFERAQSQMANTTSQLVSTIKQKRDKGEDTLRFENLLKGMGGTFKNELLERQASLTPRKVAGQAGGVALDVLGGGAIGGRVASTVTKPVSGFRGALTEGIKSAGVGGAFGGGQGVATGLQEGREGADLLTEGISGALTGAATGGVLGAAGGGVSGALRGRDLRRKQLVDELNTNPDLIARFSLDDTGKILKDKNVKEVLKQGIPEKQVAVIKNASPADKSKFKEMFTLAQTASKDARAVARPSDVVGSSIVSRTKHLMTELKQAGKEVDTASKSLKGNTVDFQPAVQSFIDDLGGMGVQFKGQKPVFSGSDIEGIKPAEDLIKKVVTRMQNVSDDALELHKLKKFIDEQVTFGKIGEGITGQTERILKGFRANIDSVLDSNFSDYNIANTKFSRARTLLDDTKSVVGRNFDPNTGNIRAGSIARRILGNSANRGDILEYLKSLDDFVRETGGNAKDDIIAQTVFADILEDIFGTQATTGLRGQVEKAVEQAGGVVQDVAQGQLLAGATRGAVRLFQATRGISDQAKIDALGKLIGASKTP